MRVWKTGKWRQVWFVPVFAVALLAACGQRGDQQPDPPAEPVTFTAEGLPEGSGPVKISGEVHYLVIRDHSSGDLEWVTISNRDGNSDDIKVMPGDLICWVNLSERPRSIEFDDPDHPLFGFGEIRIHRKQSVSIRVRLDAPATKHTYGSAHKDDAPPGIIVCPLTGC